MARTLQTELFQSGYDHSFFYGDWFFVIVCPAHRVMLA